MRRGEPLVELLRGEPAIEHVTAQCGHCALAIRVSNKLVGLVSWRCLARR
jgi:hypothetical protein